MLKMNVLRVNPNDFISNEISLKTLKPSYQKYAPFQDFIWMSWGTGILVLKNRYGNTGPFLAE